MALDKVDHLKRVTGPVSENNSFQCLHLVSRFLLPEDRNTDEFRSLLKFQGKSIPVKARYMSWGSRKLRLPDYSRLSAHEGGNVVSPMDRPSLSPGNIPGVHFC